MVRTLTLSTPEATKIEEALREYPSLPTPSRYERVRHQVGKAILTLYTSGKLVIQAPHEDVEEALHQKVIGWLGHETDELILGIDEVGRGERDGPLVVSGVLGQRNALRSLRDSKKTSNIATHFKSATQKSKVQALVSLNAEMIDELRNKGLTLNEIEGQIAQALHELIHAWAPESFTLMDGKPLAKGMRGIVFQEKADDSEPSVSAASIVAKHFRNESGDKNDRKTWKKKTPDA